MKPFFTEDELNRIIQYKSIMKAAGIKPPSFEYLGKETKAQYIARLKHMAEEAQQK